MHSKLSSPTTTTVFYFISYVCTTDNYDYQYILWWCVTSLLLNTCINTFIHFSSSSVLGAQTWMMVWLLGSPWNLNEYYLHYEPVLHFSSQLQLYCSFWLYFQYLLLCVEHSIIVFFKVQSTQKWFSVAFFCTPLKRFNLSTAATVYERFSAPVVLLLSSCP